MDVIALIEEAIEHERAAAAKYREGAEAAADAETRTMFEQLSRWEQDHERLLKDRLTALKLLHGEE
ncbi:MAG: ferritin family protein [Actinomycetota bacterium]